MRLKAGFLLAKAQLRARQRARRGRGRRPGRNGRRHRGHPQQISGFEEIKISARTVVGGGEKILNRARLMEEEIGKRLGALGAQMQRLRNAAGEGGI